ncbi:glycosyltransferase [Arcticibacterium luteifluviistationis]|uniref:Glycosyl transferase family 2 n=1 Tax=Arcticibacterium luteifluviistationis TaxID=1784714 RepID=A0A2Z4G9F6_9BACT|nr:glycosyltransferase [Arcticibacterium luteifluviistationis]AWV97862.1 glycosyl transferase family 2 [Arcticibacterium luteifluviistationis]
MSENITILIPVFNDWDALSKLLEKIEEQANLLKMRFSVQVMNDCSSLPMQVASYPSLDISVVHLLRNVGHQKAIAVGLAHLANSDAKSNVLVMDADGEDKPSDIPAMIKASTENPYKIIFAHRSKRSEGFVFRVSYQIYKFIFKLLTSKVITFGNFSIVPHTMLKKLAFVSEIWNNYPGGVIRSKLPYTSIPLERGTRLAGESKMNFVSLVLHGMSTIAVFLDVTAVRIMLFSIFLIACSFLGIAVVFELKFVAQMATPGWASSLASGFMIIVLQAFFISLFLVFTVLSYRSNKHFIPLSDYKPFIEKIEKIS